LFALRFALRSRLAKGFIRSLGKLDDCAFLRSTERALPMQ
jgi:hypothetical protein